jgi:aromatic aminotransferase
MVKEIQEKKFLFPTSETKNRSDTFAYVSYSQAFVNLVLTLCDPGDSVVMFAPYYFNAYMSFQMTGITDILVGPTDRNTLHPDLGKFLNFCFCADILSICQNLCFNQ